MLDSLFLALASQSVAYPGTENPLQRSRLGPQLVVYAADTPGAPIVVGLEEGSDLIVAIDQPNSSFGLQGTTTWRDRFVFHDLLEGPRATDGTQAEPVFPEGEFDPAARFEYMVTAGDLLYHVSTESLAVGLGTLDLVVSSELGGPLERVSVPRASPLVFDQAVGLGEKLLFPHRVTDSVVGTELWVSDGTEAGTFPLLGPELLTVGNAIQGLLSDGERVWFQGRTAESGTELWATDGTQAGTQLMADLQPGSSGSSPTRLTLFEDRIAVRASVDGVQEVWTLPRAGGMPERLPGVPSPAEPVQSMGLDGRVPSVLFVRDLEPGPGGVLWVSDGTPTGARQLQSAEPLTDAIGPMTEVASDGTFLFRGRTEAHGAELFRASGVSDTALLVEDIEPGPASSFPDQFTVAGPRIYFVAGGAGGPVLRSIEAADLGLASVQSVGMPCSLAARMEGSGSAQLGGGIQIDLVEGAPGALGALLLGTELLPYSQLVDCGLRVGPDSVLGLTVLDATGALGLALTVPSNPALAGRVIRMQHAEAQPGGAILGAFAGSNALEFVLGG